MSAGREKISARFFQMGEVWGFLIDKESFLFV